MKKIFVITLLLLFVGNALEAQDRTVRKETRKGNKEYKAKKYELALNTKLLCYNLCHISIKSNPLTIIIFVIHWSEICNTNY